MDASRPLLDLLVEHADWLRRLAVHLVKEGVEAEDVVQTTWEAALGSPPALDRPPRPWLAQVMRNAVRSARRARWRRSARETAVAQEGP